MSAAATVLSGSLDLPIGTTTHRLPDPPSHQQDPASPLHPSFLPVHLVAPSLLKSLSFLSFYRNVRRPWKPSFRTLSPAPARQSRASLEPWLWSRSTISPRPPCLAHHRCRKLQAASLFEPFVVDRFHGACLPPEQPALRPSLLLPVSPAASSPSFSLSRSLSLMAFAGSAISSRHQAAASPPMELHHPPDPVPQGPIRPFQPPPDRQAFRRSPAVPLSPLPSPCLCFFRTREEDERRQAALTFRSSQNRPTQRAPAGLLLSIVLGRGPW